MLTFADAGAVTAANKSSVADILRLLLDGIASVLARYSFILHSSPRPTVFFTWLIVPGIAYAWRRGERQVAVQALLLLLAAAGIDTLGIRRGLKSEYFIFTDPLIILAGTFLLDRLTELRFHKWAYPIAVVLFALQIVIGQAEPIKYAFMRRGPETVCEWNQHYLPLLALPLLRSRRRPPCDQWNSKNRVEDGAKADMA
jgi:TRAP-type C4-dicarboxylate transport system permease small subunit